MKALFYNMTNVGSKTTFIMYFNMVSFSPEEHYRAVRLLGGLGAFETNLRK